MCKTTGIQVMTSRGLRADGTWAITEPKLCLACKSPTVFLDVENERAKIMTCDECGAIEVITKGKAWWYHGAKQPHEWPAPFLQSLRGCVS